MMSDPFGEAVLDYLLHPSSAEIIVESDLTEPDIIPVSYLFRSESQMPDKELFALAHCQGLVLDIGAGAGSHSLLLQEKNIEVVALDRSPGCLEVMKKRGVKNIVSDDFFTLPISTQYDSLLLLMNGFGIAGTLEGLEVFLAKASALLKPGGLLIGESTDIVYLFEEEDGSFSMDLNAAYYGEMMYRMRYKTIEGDWFPWLYLSQELLLEAAKRHGFKLLHLFDGEDHDYVVVLQKK